MRVLKLIFAFLWLPVYFLGSWFLFGNLACLPLIFFLGEPWFPVAVAVVATVVAVWRFRVVWADGVKILRSR